MRGAWQKGRSVTDELLLAAQYSRGWLVGTPVGQLFSGELRVRPAWVAIGRLMALLTSVWLEIGPAQRSVLYHVDR